MFSDTQKFLTPTPHQNGKKMTSLLLKQNNKKMGSLLKLALPTLSLVIVVASIVCLHKFIKLYWQKLSK